MIYERLYDAVLFLAGAVSLLAGAWTGYWFARNAQDKPLRSPYNPAKPVKKNLVDSNFKDDPYQRALRPPGKERDNYEASL